ncbi:serine hydrolase domain-containing protein [Acidobacteriota bacterium]
MKTHENRWNRPGFLLLLIALIFSPLIGNPETTEEAFAQVDALFSEWNKPDSPGCALAVVQDGKIIYKKGYGMASLEHAIPIKPNTVFRTGSIGKQFTAACILILAHKGKLSLDDDIRTYLPEMPKYEQPITIRHLIHHTSGIREYESLQRLGGELTDQGHHTNEDIMELLTHQKGLDFPPGEKFQYSNGGYTLLAVIINRVSGKTIAEFAKEHIFDPLGMTNTFILENNRVVVKNRATGYGRANDHFEVYETLNESTGDGAVFTTVEDFFLWDQNFYRNKLDCTDFTKKMLTVGLLNDGSDAVMRYLGMEFKYAFGLVCFTYRGLNAFGHGGSYVGFRAHYMQFPAQKTSIILMSNLANINPTDLSHKVADILLKDNFTKDKEDQPRPQNKKTEGGSTPLPPGNLDDYIGDYHSDEIPVTFVLRKKEGKLHFIQNNAPYTQPLQPVAEDAFSYGTLQIKFTRSANGKVKGFEIISNHLKGMHFIKTKK